MMSEDGDRFFSITEEGKKALKEIGLFDDDD